MSIYPVPASFACVLNGAPALLTQPQYCTLLEKCPSYLLVISKTGSSLSIQMGRRKSPLHFPGGFWWLRFCFRSGLSCLKSTSTYWTRGMERTHSFMACDVEARSLSWASGGDISKKSHQTMGEVCPAEHRNTNEWGSHWRLCWHTPAGRRGWQQAGTYYVPRTVRRQEWLRWTYSPRFNIHPPGLTRDGDAWTHSWFY